MSLEEIKALKLPTADDCVLFLWATVAMLPQTLDVINTWNFAYKSHFVWDKGKTGTGYWNRNRHELLLVGVRGQVPAPAQGEQFASVITRAGRQQRQTILLSQNDRSDVSAPAAALFARGSEKSVGWAQWGNEAPL